MQHIFVVGGGVAGLSYARKLAMDVDIQITLNNKNNYQQFQPLLYQVATAIWRLRTRRSLCAPFSVRTQKGHNRWNGVQADCQVLKRW
ncbi:MAG: hypothetical protein DMG80_00250 [Acidobacteria bacterium]|jgi:NADH dehydrogenase FAD-containing subunit|nr:MAG: hypothetical protein DMG80_00250 [Acidobacteriota bacterium]